MCYTYHGSLDTSDAGCCLPFCLPIVIAGCRLMLPTGLCAVCAPEFHRQIAPADKELLCGQCYDT